MQRMLKIFTGSIAIIIASTTLAANQSFVTVHNSIYKNFHFEYEICTNHVCNGTGGAKNIFKEQISIKIDLADNQTFLINYIEQIDDNGKKVPKGLEGRCDQFATPGQTVKFWLTRADVIHCSVG